MKTRIVLSLIVVAAAGTGCKSKKADTTPAPTPEPGPALVEPAPVEPTPAEPAPARVRLTDAEFEALMARAMAMYDAMGATVDKSGGDCGKLADGLDKVLVDHQAFIIEVKAYKDDPEMAQRGEAWMKDHQDRVMAPMMKVASAGQKCAQDAKFMKVMEKLGAL